MQSYQNWFSKCKLKSCKTRIIISTVIITVNNFMLLFIDIKYVAYTSEFVVYTYNIFMILAFNSNYFYKI